MPGEHLRDALDAAVRLQEMGIATILTHLGENISDPVEADSSTGHYLEALDRIRELRLSSGVSIKLTQLGLDLDSELCYQNVEKIIRHAEGRGAVWIDMESSAYVDATLALFRRIKQNYSNVGLCLQSYLYRTATDLASLIALGAVIRLVKGAYLESREIAFARKQDVDENFFTLAKQLLSVDAQRAGVRAALATHDLKLIQRITEYCAALEVPKGTYEFQMLYGIQSKEQFRLAAEGYRSVVLITYGTAWFSWFTRRLAERPANVLFLVRHLLR